MRRFILVAACALALPAAALAQGNAPTPEAPRLSVTGEGSAVAVPDMATVTVGVSARNADAGAAMDEASGLAAAVLARLDALGIAARDRQSSDISLQPIWSDHVSGEERRVTGYEARNELSVRVRDLAALGDVLAAVTEDGADRLSGLRFGLQDPDPVMEQARRDAVADAMERARVLADAAGLALGPVLSLSEGGSGSGPAPMFEARAMASVPVATGETTLSAHVTMVFEMVAQ